MKLVYGVNQRPPVGKMIISAFQQLLAILAATIAVPAIIGHGMSASAALLGAGVGTIVYLLFTRFKSPVFLGSSFAFLGSMSAAFAGAATIGASETLGFLGLIIGALMAGLVYVVIALIVKFVGVKWINKLMPAVVIGPTVAIIGLSLAGNATGDLMKGSFLVPQIVDGVTSMVPTANTYLALGCGLVTLITVIICSVYGKKNLRLFPFVIGILAGYAVAAIFTLIGTLTNVDALKVIDFSKFKNMEWLPDFAFLEAFKGNYGVDAGTIWGYVGTIAAAYIPVAFVVFAEHIADHKNLSTIIGSDLLNEPGLTRTLLGDGVGSIAGAFFGGCPNTTYGESVGCVAITGNASVYTIFLTACIAILSAFVAPFVTFLATIPSCVMGGVCISLYGFIACSGLKMVQKVDLNDNANLFVVSVILICGVGGLSLSFGKVTITTIATSLILGIIVNLIVKRSRKNDDEDLNIEKAEVADETVENN